jgi:hypothetical protein
MPWKVGSHDSCPADKAHAVLAKKDGKLVGCYASPEEAKAKIDELYAKEPGAKKMSYGDAESYFAAESARAFGRTFIRPHKRGGKFVKGHYRTIQGLPSAEFRRGGTALTRTRSPYYHLDPVGASGVGIVSGRPPAPPKERVYPMTNAGANQMRWENARQGIGYRLTASELASLAIGGLGQTPPIASAGPWGAGAEALRRQRRRKTSAKASVWQARHAEMKKLIPLDGLTAADEEEVLAHAVRHGEDAGRALADTKRAKQDRVEDIVARRAIQRRDERRREFSWPETMLRLEERRRLSASQPSEG